MTNNCSSHYKAMPEDSYNYTSDTVDIGFLESGEVFCFVAVAKGTSSSYMAILEGSFIVDSYSKTKNDSFHEKLIIIICSLVMVVIVFSIIFIIGQIIILKKRCTRAKILTSQAYAENHSHTTTEESNSEYNQTVSFQCHTQADELAFNYAEIGDFQDIISSRNVFDKDEVQYAEIDITALHDSHCVPECNLDSVLIQIRSKATPKWYQFGQVIGIADKILDEYSKYPNEECIVEVIDYWFRNSLSTPTWRHLAEALKEIDLYDLAENILKVYESGKLPTEADY